MNSSGKPLLTRFIARGSLLVLASAFNSLLATLILALAVVASLAS